MMSVKILLKLRWIGFVLLLIAPVVSWSQSTSPATGRADSLAGGGVGSRLFTDPIVIVRRYKPKLAESVKWQMVPDLPTMSGDSVPVRFESLNLSSPPFWVPEPGSLPALPPAPPATPHRLWWEAGVGNLWGTHAAVDYRSAACNKIEWGVFAERDGARGTIRADGREWKDVRSSDALARFDGRTTIGRSTQFDAAVFHERRGRSLFGRDTTDPLFSMVDYQLFQKWGAQTGFRSSLRKGTWWVGGRFSGYTLSDQRKQNERNLRFSADLEGKLGMGSNQLELVVDATRFENLTPKPPDGGVGELRRVVWLRDLMRFQLGRWEMATGFQLAVQGTDEVSTPELFPHIEGALPSVNRKHRVLMGITGDVERVSFDDVTHLNPFIAPNPQLRNTINRVEAFAGARGQLGAGLHYRFRASVRRLDDALFFLNQVDSFNRMYPVYDAATEWGLSGGLEQVWGRSWRFSSSIEYTLPKPDSLLQFWMTPTLRSLTSLQWSPTEKLTIRTEWSYLNGIFVASNPDPTGFAYRRLPEMHNVNLHLTYQHRPGFDFFMHGGNLASINYFRWFGYPTFSTQLIAGIRRTL
ncbi:MAG: hypothetical protein FJ344_00335 [Sphingomonadales bacterium]|nr:hypothetical protein [Sphingomonadales bacterium]